MGPKAATIQYSLWSLHCFSVPPGPATSAAVLIRSPGTGVARQTYARARRSTQLQPPIASFRLCAALGYGVRLARHPIPRLTYQHCGLARRQGWEAKAMDGARANTGWVSVFGPVLALAM